MVDFGCRFFTVYAEVFTVYKGHKRWKINSLLMIFSRLVFHGLPPLETLFLNKNVQSGEKSPFLLFVHFQDHYHDLRRGLKPRKKPGLPNLHTLWLCLTLSFLLSFFFSLSLSLSLSISLSLSFCSFDCFRPPASSFFRSLLLLLLLLSANFVFPVLPLFSINYIYIYADELVGRTRAPIIWPHLEGRNFRFLDRKRLTKRSDLP